MHHNKMRVFTGRANPALAERIATQLNDSLGNLKVESFPDTETSVRIDEDVRGRDVFIVQPTCPPVNEHLMELLVILDAFKRASPNRVTAVLPYYGYARQDRKDSGRVPISAKLVADLLTTAGAHRVLALDLHAAQIQGFFNIPVDELIVLSPDEGSIKKALVYQKRVGGKITVVDKRRSSGTDVKHGFLL